MVPKRRQDEVKKPTSQGNDGLPDRRLLKPGWAGELSDDELEYIQHELKRSRKLSRNWGFFGTLLKGVSAPSAIIRRIAKYGPR